jgi:dihydrofolate reductase
VIITRNRAYHADGCQITHSLSAALSLAEENGETEAFICGGSQIYQEGLGLADRLNLTRVHTRVKADVYFPEMDLQDWVKIFAEPIAADAKHPYAFTFFCYQKKHQHAT